MHGFDPQKGFTVHTTRAYEPGEQVFINYGHHGNLRLLRNYGFTLPINPYDAVDIPLPVNLQQVHPSDTMFQEKQDLLHSLRFGNPGTTVTKKTLQLSRDGQLSAASHQWLQVLLASRDELQGIFQQATAARATDSASPSSLQLPPSLMSKICQEVADICTDRIKSHKSSLEVLSTCSVEAFYPTARRVDSFLGSSSRVRSAMKASFVRMISKWRVGSGLVCIYGWARNGRWRTR